jgi:hypothetical protein
MSGGQIFAIWRMISMTKAAQLSPPVPLVIEAKNVSEAYAKILVHICDHPGKEIAPLVLSISGFSQEQLIPEDAELRIALDDLLKKKGKSDIEDVAHTIFPQRFWTMAQGDRAQLFAFYKMAFPAYQKRNPKLNGRGLYFERLMMYGRGPCDGNQLEWILSQYESRHDARRSMWQSTTFDPSRDHTNTAQLGFPCLQQVSFVPTKAGLVANAFYATQQVFDKAYGNYLGLARLGAFMAHEMKMPLVQLNVMVGVAKLERITKSDPQLKQLLATARACIGKKSAISQSVAASAQPAFQPA